MGRVCSDDSRRFHSQSQWSDRRYCSRLRNFPPSLRLRRTERLSDKDSTTRSNIGSGGSPDIGNRQKVVHCNLVGPHSPAAVLSEHARLPSPYLLKDLGPKRDHRCVEGVVHRCFDLFRIAYIGRQTERRSAGSRDIGYNSFHIGWGERDGARRNHATLAHRYHRRCLYAGDPGERSIDHQRDQFGAEKVGRLSRPKPGRVGSSRSNCP